MDVKSYVEKSKNLHFDEEGNIVYLSSLYRQHDILFMIIKLFFYICLGIGLLVGIAAGEMTAFMQVFAITFSTFLVLSVVSFYLLAFLKGGKYHLVFVMNKKGAIIFCLKVSIKLQVF